MIQLDPFPFFLGWTSKEWLALTCLDPLISWPRNVVGGIMQSKYDAKIIELAIE